MVFITFEDFNGLYSKDLSAKYKKKNDFDYLPWAVAWAELKKGDPNAVYEFITNNEGSYCFEISGYAWVKVSVQAYGVTHTMSLPILDFKNRPVKFENVDSATLNRAMMRCFTKCMAMFGVALKLYEGEDTTPQKTGGKQPRRGNEKSQEETELEMMQNQITARAKQLIADGVAEVVVSNIVMRHNHGKKRIASIQTCQDCEAILNEFDNLTK